MQDYKDNRLAVPSSDSVGDIDLLSLVSTLWRGSILILIFMLCTMLLGGYYAFVVAVPTYSASTQMSLQIRTERLIDVESVLSGISSDVSSINTEMAVLRSRELIGRLVDRLHLIENPEFNPLLRAPGWLSFGAVKGWIGRLMAGFPETEESVPAADDIRNGTIDRVRNAITATIGYQSFVFTISATTQNARTSALLANTLAELYRDDQIALKVEATENAAIWLSARVAELEIELEDRQGRISALRSGSVLVSDEALAALNSQSVTVNGALQTAELALSRAEARVAALQAVLDADPATRATAADDSQLQALVSAASSGDALAAQRFERRFEQIVAQYRGDVTRESELVTDLQERAATLAAQFEEQSQMVVQVQQLERESEATRVLYETFLTRLKETTVQVGVHQADSRVLSAATGGTYVAPKKSRITVLAMLLGLLAGSAVVLMREFLQNTYRSADDLERRTGHTVLGQIPQIPAKTREETIAYLAAKPTSASAEAIRNLRTSILLSNIDKVPQVILSTSSIPGEGKTTLAVALAQNLAGLEKRVILIEGDIRRRTFTAYFPDAAKNAGILSVLSQKVSLTDAVWHHPTLNIDVLMGEKSSINAADTFSSARFRDLMSELREIYDHIIIDTPPVLVVPDARVIAPVADAVIYAVHWDKTTRTQVEEGLKELRNVNIHVSGMVLSQIDPEGMRRYGYGNYYGADSRHARGYYDN